VPGPQGRVCAEENRGNIDDLGDDLVDHDVPDRTLRPRLQKQRKMNHDLMARPCPLLIPFWIKGTDPHGPHGFGVTAWSIEDAFGLIRDLGYRIDEERAVIHPYTQPHEVGYAHVGRNAGPAFFRGIWYPCLNIGWGASGQR